MTIDDLDLAFEDRADKGRHRRGYRKAAATGKKKRKGGGGKTAIAFFMALILLGGLGAGAWYGFDRIQGYFTTPDYDGAGTGEKVNVEVKQLETATDIANTLFRADVVKSAKAFVDAADADSRSKNIQPGVYGLQKQMSGKAALAVLVDPKNKIVNGVTVPEGLTMLGTFKKLSEQTKIPVKDFQNAAKNVDSFKIPDYWFTRKDGKKVTKSLEGFLFPDTYEMPPKPNAKQVLDIMVNRFLTVVGEMKFTDNVEKNRGGIAPYEALIVASLAQAEAGNKDDLGKIARVAYNRVYVKDMLLQFDVTLNYGLEVAGKKTKASKDMDQSDYADETNKYNTHLYKGLTPTPIDNPGKQALEGAMNPPAGNWLFFVAIDKEGHSAFAETDAEHEANKVKAREAGIIN
ncbi:endolytic transglycosylase MltG [Asanoa sp. WMMD1127]|uniref:endolytic transglycosylase MltG n=1 Tax=Asanoa sp. WMMD1127 TaxID=3016107 RepID=UPI00241742F5|nr:endolytic transglycosylase MltG [Asanoa sp. WMMD1127]MDG4824444.1 endolytic transglycosylase MltG [Asanoa sp. WMMD1127]